MFVSFLVYSNCRNSPGMHNFDETYAQAALQILKLFYAI